MQLELEKLDLLTKDHLLRVDNSGCQLLRQLSVFEYSKNPSCGFAPRKDQQLWSFDEQKHVINLNLELNKQMDFMLVCSPGSDVLVNLRLNSLRDSKMQIETILQENAKLELNILVEDSSLKSCLDLRVLNLLMQSNANCNLNIVYDLQGSSRINLDVKHKFLQSANSGRILINGIMDEQAIAQVNGCIYIGADANQTDSELRQEVLLLGDKARNFVTPALEIFTDDVKAAHSVSVAQLSEEIMFYMASRGLDFLQAKQLYKQAMRNKLFSFDKLEFNV